MCVIPSHAADASTGRPDSRGSVQTPVGIRSVFFGLRVQFKVISLQMDEEIEMSWSSTAPMLHDKEVDV